MIAFLFRKMRWMLLGAGLKYAARLGVSRSVDEAASKLEDRLPASVVRAANALPGDVIKVGGAAAISARAARRGGSVAVRTGAAAARTGAVAARVTRAGVTMRPRSAITDRIRSARDSVTDQAELDRRDLLRDFRYYNAGGGAAGETAATEAMLDLRSEGRPLVAPLPPIPPPVPSGRRRFVRALRAPEVGRVQRTYRPPQKPWDRRLRKSSEQDSSSR